MISVGIVGFQGFVGNSLYREFQKYLSIQLYGINRQNFFDPNIEAITFDYLIHAANPAKRYIANSDPYQDYVNTVEKTKLISQKYRFKALLLISTVSVRLAPDSPYGRNRAICEEFVQRTCPSTVIRLGPLFGGTRKKDTLHDIATDANVHYSADTRYSYTNVDWIAQYVATNITMLDKPLYEIGASNHITLGEIALHIGSRSSFNSRNDDQIILNCPNGPDARLVLSFASNLRRELLGG